MPEDNKRLSALRTVSNAGIREEVVEILRDAIWRRLLQPGERLNEQAISDQILVSRPPLREAIRVLEMEGLVETLPRRGSFVRRLDGSDVLEIYTAECALEGMAAELVIARADPKAIDDLEAHLAALEAMSAQFAAGRAAAPTGDGSHHLQVMGVDDDGELPAIIACDIEFHRALVRHSANSRLLTLWEQIASQLRLALTRIDPTFFDPEYIGATHRPLVDAIRRADNDEADRLIRTLLDVGLNLKMRWDDVEDAADAATPVGGR